MIANSNGVKCQHELYTPASSQPGCRQGDSFWHWRHACGHGSDTFSCVRCLFLWRNVCLIPALLCCALPACYTDTKHTCSLWKLLKLHVGRISRAFKLNRWGKCALRLIPWTCIRFEELLLSLGRVKEGEFDKDFFHKHISGRCAHRAFACSSNEPVRIDNTISGKDVPFSRWFTFENFPTI